MSPDMGHSNALDGLAGERVVSETSQEVAEAVATWVAAQSRRAHADHGNFSIALSGGTTPRLLNELLAGPEWRARIDWSWWNVYFADERACPPDDPRSNYFLAETTLLRHVPIDPNRVHRMPAERPDLDAAAAEYSGLLAASLPSGIGGAPRLDVILLGLGDNGHTASLFPGTRALDVADRWATRGLADYEPYDRITLTFPAINAAAAIGFMVTGASKHPALVATARGEVPASRVRPIDGTLAWFLDAAAAAG
ncbi:MAG: 6-phosphogluconolactonase [Candidatus Dormibacteria bacterium]